MSQLWLLKTIEHFNAILDDTMMVVIILPTFPQNTIAGRMAYFPIVGRLDCKSSSLEHQGFWEMRGYGIMAIYKSDWDRFRGKSTQNHFRTNISSPFTIYFTFLGQGNEVTCYELRVQVNKYGRCFVLQILFNNYSTSACCIWVVCDDHIQQASGIILLLKTLPKY